MPLPVIQCVLSVVFLIVILITISPLESQVLFLYDLSVVLKIFDKVEIFRVMIRHGFESREKHQGWKGSVVSVGPEDLLSENFRNILLSH